MQAIAAVNGRESRILLSAPPGSGSSAGENRFPLFLEGENPFSVVVSDQAAQALNSLEALRVIGWALVGMRSRSFITEIDNEHFA
ncbi:MAG: hypothetical protein IPN75_17955 [Dechloromonas sp.]|uniref:Uncharacterized protein n=1 Tax=Candidatus Dechloromonas phosphorivorans TaxID=2899244 RepID=A0A9D7LS39_9RHOO|nr:hypothetical protein [Candidatus Dechloromonas phosphorivorans]